ncbi:MAG: WYL domain-containing protein [Alistipes sp.]|nr:WYL domain-containing protein [Alistipes sp.]
MSSRFATFVDINPNDMRIINQIRRLVRLTNKILSVPYISREELIAYVKGFIGDDGDTITARTLQRDFHTIYDLFGIEITFDRSIGAYCVKSRGRTAPEDEALLQNFELLSRIDEDAVLVECVMPERRRPPLGEYLHEILTAIRKHYIIEFDYEHYRDGGRMSRHTLSPQFLKESQQRWYIVGYNLDDKLRVYAVERITGVRFYHGKRFKPKPNNEILALFDESFGIWADERIPVEDVVLRYDSLDGSFLKSLPLHHSQQIIAEDNHSITIGLRLRITNDFVMALLMRSRSLEVLSPLSLRQRMEHIYREALERNKTNDEQCTIENR